MQVAAALFATAALLPKENEDVKVVVSMVEEVVAQADEVNKSQLQFEGILFISLSDGTEGGLGRIY